MRDFDRRTIVAGLAGGIVAWPIAARAAEAGRVFTIPITIESNRVQLSVGMNGKGPYTFMIDTGTYVSLIRPDLAKELKLPVQGQERTKGVGGQGGIFNLYLARDFTIGGAVRQPTVILEDSFEFGYQQGVYGALAAGILTAGDTELDFDAGELRIYPDGRGDRPGFVAIDSEIPRADEPHRGSRKISATVLLDGRPIRCILDTGSPNLLTLNQTAARRLGLWNDERPYAPNRPRGIGGAGPVARILRAQSLQIGDAREDRPLITALGTSLSDEFDGIVGLSFIRRFNLSIDSRGRKLWVKPSRQVAPPVRYGLTGLWLDRDGSKINVAAVGPGSPAAQAGIRAGDHVVGDWAAVLRTTGGPEGSVAALKIERDGTTRDVSLTLKPWL